MSKKESNSKDEDSPLNSESSDEDTNDKVDEVIENKKDTTDVKNIDEDKTKALYDQTTNEELDKLNTTERKFSNQECHGDKTNIANTSSILKISDLSISNIEDDKSNKPDYDQVTKVFLFFHKTGDFN